MIKPLTILVASILMATIAPPASAAVARTWVSHSGVDSGNCQLAAPCKTFQYAYTQTTANGEINVQNSGGYGPLTINKSISIISDGAVASVGAPAGQQE